MHKYALMNHSDCVEMISFFLQVLFIVFIQGYSYVKKEIGKAVGSFTGFPCCIVIVIMT
jgi:hypothetical protein